MFKNQRHEQILHIINEKKSATVGFLAKSLFVSDATVRRDLAELERIGAIGRSHGGAFLLSTSNAENSASVREKQNLNKKRRIAELAKSFISGSATLFIDSSSSVGQLLSFIHGVKGLTIITNGIGNCVKAMEIGGARVLLCGGEATPASDALIGPEAEQFISNYLADVCIISCGGISDRGVTEASTYQAEIKRRMIANSKKCILLADSTKSGKSCLCRIADFDAFDMLITDAMPSERLAAQIKEQSCEIVVCK